MSWQIYLQYDEDSLATYANAGLVRRAQKALDQVQLDSQDEQLHFIIDEFQVTLPAQGITDAQCNCPVQGCCKHILSGIFWIQQHPEQLNPASSDGQSTVSAQSNDEDNTIGALDSALQLDAQQLLKKLRKAERQLAIQIFSEWQSHPEQCQIDIQAEKISFKTPYSDAAILYFPQTGFTGMISDLAEKHKQACHIACIAYLFQQHHPEKWQWSEELQTSLKSTSSATTLSQEDIDFIGEIKKMCLSFIHQGLSHIAKESILALHLLNMQARAQNLPRLASELRGLYGVLQRLDNADIQVDEEQVFDRLAFLYSYLHLLEQFAQQPEQLQRIKGQTQRDYEEHQINHLIPLGGEWWHTASGARGLSLCFWNVEAEQLTEVTQARANTLDSTFSQSSAAQSGIWGKSIDYLCQHQIKLTKCKITANQHISSSTDTQLEILAEFKQLNKETFKTQVSGIDDWQQLKTQLLPQSSLDMLQQRYQLLHIDACAALELNEIEQRFECWVTDKHGQQLQLSLSIDPHNHAKIEKLQYQITQKQIIAILIRIERQGQHIYCLPCSLVLMQKQGLRIFNLDYDAVPYWKQKQSFLQQLTGRISQLLERKHKSTSTHQSSALELTLQHIQNLLIFYANTGRQQFDSDDLEQLNQAIQQLDDLGLTVASKSFHSLLQQPSQHIAEKLLKWRYLLLLIQQLLIHIPIKDKAT